MYFLRFITCAILMLSVSGQTLNLRVPLRRRAGSIELLQGDFNDVVDVAILVGRAQGFSAQCSLELQGLNTGVNGQSALFQQYTTLAAQSLITVLSDVISGEDIVNNTGRRVEINAPLLVNVASSRETFEGLASQQRAQVADITFSQLFTYEAPGNSFEVLTAYDLYYAIPNSCDFREVQNLALQLVTAIEGQSELFEDEVTNIFSASIAIFDSNGFPLDFNGGSGFATGLTLSGDGVVSDPDAPAAAILFSLQATAPGAPQIQTPEVPLKITDGTSSEEWAKAACATLNSNEDFAQTFRCLCDVSERVPANGPFNMTIYCPYDENELSFLCRADPNSEDNQLPIGNSVPCTSFTGLGVSLSGSTVPFGAELMPTNEIPPTEDNEPARTIPTFVNGNTNPPQVNVGNGQAPPLVDVLNGPPDGVSATRPTFIVVVACAIVTFFTSRC